MICVAAGSVNPTLTVARPCGVLFNEGQDAVHCARGGGGRRKRPPLINKKGESVKDIFVLYAFFAVMALNLLGTFIYFSGLQTFRDGLRRAFQNRQRPQ